VQAGLNWENIVSRGSQKREANCRRQGNYFTAAALAQGGASRTTRLPDSVFRVRGRVNVSGDLEFVGSVHFDRTGDFRPRWREKSAAMALVGAQKFSVSAFILFCAAMREHLWSGELRFARVRDNSPVFSEETLQGVGARLGGLVVSGPRQLVLAVRALHEVFSIVFSDVRRLAETCFRKNNLQATGLALHNS
jgi:hypothetical protein